VEKDSEPANRALRAPRLRFKLIQNDSVQFPFSERTLPLTEESIAGYCALHAGAIELADAYRIPKAGGHFISIHRSIRDGLSHTLAVALPMKNGKGEVLGVLQLINCKRNPKARLTDTATVRRWVRAFPERAIRLGLSLASQAAWLTRIHVCTRT